jgi:copper chaperone
MPSTVIRNSLAGVGPGSANTSTELAVEGMHCASCVLLIEETLADDPAIRSVHVDLDSARATVTFDPTATSVEAVCAMVEGLGYPAGPLVGESGT